MRSILAGLLLVALAGCATASEEADIVPIEISPPGPAGTVSLEPADAAAPSTGICAEAQGSEAVVSFNPGFPDPHCLIVTPDQRLRLINRLEEPVEVSLGSVSVILDPSSEGTVGPRFGDYLAPGVHFLEESAYEGDPEIWLR